MILIEKISCNVKSDIDLKLVYQNMNNHGKVEKISVGRVESERVRMRKVSDKGTDLALTLPQGISLTRRRRCITYTRPYDYSLHSTRKCCDCRILQYYTN